MNCFFLFVMICFGTSAKSQEAFSLLTDSLTNNESRTWVRCNDTSLKQNAANCFRGKQYTFFKKDRKGKRVVCIDGKWIENEFSWLIEKKDDEHWIRIINEGAANDNFVIQVIKENNVSKARLTQRDYDRKEMDRFCTFN